MRFLFSSNNGEIEKKKTNPLKLYILTCSDQTDKLNPTSTHTYVVNINVTQNEPRYSAKPGTKRGRWSENYSLFLLLNKHANMAMAWRAIESRLDAFFARTGMLGTRRLIGGNVGAALDKNPITGWFNNGKYYYYNVLLLRVYLF